MNNAREIMRAFYRQKDLYKEPKSLNQIIDQALEKAYNKGYAEGKKDGYVSATNKAIETIKNS